MDQIAKFIIAVGLVIVLLGIVIYFVGRVPHVGKLPGDIYIKKENFTFYFPVTTCLIISLILSLIIFLWNQK